MIFSLWNIFASWIAHLVDISVDIMVLCLAIRFNNTSVKILSFQNFFVALLSVLSRSFPSIKLLSMHVLLFLFCLGRLAFSNFLTASHVFASSTGQGHLKSKQKDIWWDTELFCFENGGPVLWTTQNCTGHKWSLSARLENGPCNSIYWKTLY